MNIPHILVTESAKEHFNHLIAKEEMPGMGLRIFLDGADVSIAFCPPGEHRGTDIPLSFEGFTLYIDRASRECLEGAEIDFKKEALGGQLAISAPNLRRKSGGDSSLSERVNDILTNEINPSLAGHGGKVSLVEITPSNEVILRFGGGCHGCGMADVTLKQGIEKALMSQLPEVVAVIDVTDHSTGENPYYATT